jgi:predicted  nucleic acid-binding Zn-ribbon protein
VEIDAYKIWSHLHFKSAQGESLTPEERIAYEVGRRELEAEETLPGSVLELQQARQRTQELQSEYERLQAEFVQLSEKIAEEEARLSAPTRQLLGVGER